MKTSVQFARLARGHVLRSVAVGLALSLSPLLSSSAPLRAESPASSVTGLGLGSRGDAVRAVQHALVNQGVAVPGGADGVFGAGTAAALKQFQSSKGLSVTGTVDQATALALGLASSPLFGLIQGTKSDAVKQLQQKLIDQGITVPGGADGIFGVGTSAALKQFQTARGIAATGIVDAATAAALGSVTVSTPAATPAEVPAAAPVATPAAGSQSLVGLKVGARSEGVKRLQQILLGVGYSALGSADGIFGTRTAGALSAFQRAQGIAATGVVDDATAAVLATVGGTHNPSATNPLIGLKLGASGGSVKRLQETLIAAGVTVRGGADGKFGNATVVAVKAYQAAKGLPQSGSIDEATGNALASGGGVGPGTTASPFAGLKPGSLGNAVKDLQTALLKAGATVRGGADGVFGPATSAALKAFQRAQGILETGVVDDATIAALANPKPVTAAPAAGASDGFAVFGELGTRVIALQGALASAGFPPKGGSDGDFGAGTSASIVDFQRAKGLSVTGKVNSETAAALGLAAMPAPAAGGPVSVTLQVFPVQGRCFYGDSWGYPRPGGRTHLGVDVIAPAGKLIYAVADGKITKVYGDYPGSLSGNGVRLTMPDGTYFFYAHMTGIAEGIGVGVPVKAGQIIGTIGNSGSSGTPHLHFEVHPRGGTAVNPYPIIKAIDGCRTTDPLPQP